VRYVRSTGIGPYKAPTAQTIAAYLIAGAVVGFDQLTKRWAAIEFADAPRPIIPGILTFRFTENPGAAFSLFENAGPFLGIAAVIAVGLVGAGLAKKRPMYEVVGFGLIIGGAIGNLVDRIARGPGFLDGRVIDWVQLPNFPTFNLADSAITLAVVTLLIGSWRSDKQAGNGRTHTA
jgi:signal peptidase II